eukprot:14463990-Ditylum_brightwellii.AAC.1
MEDDEHITSNFMENLRKYAALAPQDWNILQLTTSNININKREAYNVRDYWTNWKPFHWGTVAYAVHQEGVEEVLNHAFKA